MAYRAWFECINRCGEKYPLDEVIYECKKCGALLEVVHDETELSKHSGEKWKAIFDARYMKPDWPYGSGVWGKKEWVLPGINNENIVSMCEGGSNLFWAERLGKIIGVPDLWIKMCGNSHTGSFKDLGMTVLVSAVKQMIADGKNVSAVACASTGDTSAALAAYAAAAGIQSIVFLPKGKVSHAQLIQPLANGALVLALETDFDGCMKVVQQVCQDNNIYLANSMNSLRIEGQKTVGIEIVQQFDWQVPEWIIIPGGNLGNVSALGKGLRLMGNLGLIDRYPRICCAQAENANPLYQSYLTGFKEKIDVQAKTTLASAIQIGHPVSYDKAVDVLADENFKGVVEQASEDELANATALADTTGTFACPHTGVALAACFKLVEKGIIKPTDRVVVISTAHGLKFTEFKTDYHKGYLNGIESKYANPPISTPADPDAIKRIINERLEKKAREGHGSK